MTLPSTVFLSRPTLIGMVHLLPLPGSPRHETTMEQIIQRACADASVLAEAGFNALIVENFGDAPFFAQCLDPAATAAISVVADRVRQNTQLPMGINALRNDARAAIAIATAVGAEFIRVNVHTGVAATDQGLISGRAAETLRYRKLLGAEVAILADVHVKHATPISQPDIAEAARDTAYRGLADGLIVTGSATGSAANLDDVRRVREAVPDRILLVGSGVTADTVGEALQVADGVIVGSALKLAGDPGAPVDFDLARRFVDASRGN